MEKSTKFTVSRYSVPVPSSRYLRKKLSIGDAIVRRKKDYATVKFIEIDFEIAFLLINMKIII